MSKVANIEDKIAKEKAKIEERKRIIPALRDKLDARKKELKDARAKGDDNAVRLLNGSDGASGVIGDLQNRLGVIYCEIEASELKIEELMETLAEEKEAEKERRIED